MRSLYFTTKAVRVFRMVALGEYGNGLTLKLNAVIGLFFYQVELE